MATEAGVSLPLDQRGQAGPGVPARGRIHGRRVPRSLVSRRGAPFAAQQLALVGLAMVLVIVGMAVFADDWFISLPLGRKPQPLPGPHSL